MRKNQTYICPFCGKGQMNSQKIDYEICDAVGEKIVIPDIGVDICDRCGERFFGFEAAQKLEEHKKRHQRFILRLKPELRSRIMKLAEKHNRSLGQEINDLLEERLLKVS